MLGTSTFTYLKKGKHESNRLWFLGDNCLSVHTIKAEILILLRCHYFNLTEKKATTSKN